jgi:hypothetical protein
MIETRPLAPLLQRSRTMLQRAGWALRLGWAASPQRLAGVAAVSVLRGLVPAGLALSARGIVKISRRCCHGCCSASP